MKVTGAANGTLVLSNIFSETQTKITQIIDHLGFKSSHQILLETSKETSNLKSLWRVKQSNSKSFVDYQPEGSLKGTFFDYVPDAYQVSDWLRATLSSDGPNKNIDGSARKGKTKGQK